MRRLSFVLCLAALSGFSIPGAEASDRGMGRGFAGPVVGRAGLGHAGLGRAGLRYAGPGRAYRGGFGHGRAPFRGGYGLGYGPGFGYGYGGWPAYGAGYDGGYPALSQQAAFAPEQAVRIIPEIPTVVGIQAAPVAQPTLTILHTPRHVGRGGSASRVRAARSPVVDDDGNALSGPRIVHVTVRRGR